MEMSILSGSETFQHAAGALFTGICLHGNTEVSGSTTALQLQPGSSDSDGEGQHDSE